VALLRTAGGFEAEADIRRRLTAKEVVIGFGHSVYTIADPRNEVIKRVARTLTDYVAPSATIIGIFPIWSRSDLRVPGMSASNYAYGTIYRSELRKWAIEEGYVIADYEDAFGPNYLGPTVGWLNDNIHPTVEGPVAVAKAFAAPCCARRRRNWHSPTHSARAVNGADAARLLGGPHQRHLGAGRISPAARWSRRATRRRTGRSGRDHYRRTGFRAAGRPPARQGPRFSCLLGGRRWRRDWAVSRPTPTATSAPGAAPTQSLCSRHRLRSARARLSDSFAGAEHGRLTPLGNQR